MARLETEDGVKEVAGLNTSLEVVCVVVEEDTDAVTSEDSLLFRQLPFSSTTGVIKLTPTPAHIEVNLTKVTF